MAESSKQQRNNEGEGKLRISRKMPGWWKLKGFYDFLKSQHKRRKRWIKKRLRKVGIIAFFLGAVLGAILAGIAFSIFFKTLDYKPIVGIENIVGLLVILVAGWLIIIPIVGGTRVTNIYSTATFGVSIGLLGLLGYLTFSAVEKLSLMDHLLELTTEIDNKVDIVIERTSPELRVTQLVDLSVEVTTLHNLADIPPECVLASPPTFTMGLRQDIEGRYSLQGDASEDESQLVSLELSDFSNVNRDIPIKFSELSQLDTAWENRDGVYFYLLPDFIENFSFVIAQERIGEEFRATVTITDECGNYTRIDPVVKAE